MANQPNTDLHPTKIALIVAVGECGTIGDKGTMPWHLPADLKWFVKNTKYHTVIMGRRTFESIGKPLPNRTNIVLTRDKNWLPPKGIYVKYDLHDAISFARQLPQNKHLKETQEDYIFIIGGANIFDQIYPYASYYYLTIVHAQFDGDTKLETPILSPKLTNDWEMICQENFFADEKNRYNLTFYKLRRRSK